MTNRKNPAQSNHADSPIRIEEADLGIREHQDAVRAMVDAYSRDPMGDAKPLA